MNTIKLFQTVQCEKYLVNSSFTQFGHFYQARFAIIHVLRMPTTAVANLIKHFTIVIYDSRVVLTTNLPILRLYDRKMFIRLATGC